MKEATKPRRWMQWSIRSILLLMLLVCVFFAGRMSLQTQVNRLRAENEAVRAQAMEARAVAEQAAQKALVARQNAQRAQVMAMRAAERLALSQAKTRDDVADGDADAE